MRGGACRQSLATPPYLCAPQCISLSVVCDWLRAAGYELSEVATPTFCARVAKADEEHPLFALKSL